MPELRKAKYDHEIPLIADQAFALAREEAINAGLSVLEVREGWLVRVTGDAVVRVRPILKTLDAKTLDAVGKLPVGVPIRIRWR